MTNVEISTWRVSLLQDLQKRMSFNGSVHPSKFSDSVAGMSLMRECSVSVEQNSLSFAVDLSKKKLRTRGIVFCIFEMWLIHMTIPSSTNHNPRGSILGCLGWNLNFYAWLCQETVQNELGQVVQLWIVLGLLHKFWTLNLFENACTLCILELDLENHHLRL